MSKNINDAFFLVTRNLGHEQEKYISTVGNLCPETHIVATNHSNLDAPGVLAKSWNINKATFLLSISTPSVMSSIIEQLKRFMNDQNTSHIIVDSPSNLSEFFNDAGYLNEESDPIWTKEKHNYVLLKDFNKTIQNITNNSNSNNELIEHNISQITETLNETINNLNSINTSLTNELNILKVEKSQLISQLNSMRSELTNLNNILNNQTKKINDLFNMLNLDNDGILIVKNGTVSKISSPSTPSVLTSSSSSYSWYEYEVCQ